jgi:hypothetical protein
MGGCRYHVCSQRWDSASTTKQTTKQTRLVSSEYFGFAR